MYAVYIDCYLHSMLDNEGRKMGLHRAVVDLGHSIEPLLPEKNSELASDETLKKLASPGSITYAKLLANPLPPPTRATLLRKWWETFRIKTWLRSEWYWLGLLIVTLTLTIASNAFSVHGRAGVPVCNAMLLTSLFLVLCAGRTSKSRWLIFAFAALSYIVLTITSYKLVTY